MAESEKAPVPASAAAPTPVPPPPVPPEPKKSAAPRATEFAFHYEGPISQRQTPGCILCIAAAGMQPPHNCMPGCAICAAGRTKVCTSHQGMTVALDEASVAPSMQGVFEAARAVAEKALAGATGASNVRIKMFGQSGIPDAPPRTVNVEVTLLNEAASSK